MIILSSLILVVDTTYNSIFEPYLKHIWSIFQAFFKPISSIFEAYFIRYEMSSTLVVSRWRVWASPPAFPRGRPRREMTSASWTWWPADECTACVPTPGPRPASGKRGSRTASDWSRQVTWQEYWPLIGQGELKAIIRRATRPRDSSCSKVSKYCGLFLSVLFMKRQKFCSV